jgi:hypothetical protein
MTLNLFLRQRSGREFCVKLGKSNAETLHMIENAYGTKGMRRATVFQWWKHFKARNIRVVDDTQSGGTSNVVMDVNIDIAEQMLKEDSRLSLR